MPVHNYFQESSALSKALNKRYLADCTTPFAPLPGTGFVPAHAIFNRGAVLRRSLSGSCSLCASKNERTGCSCPLCASQMKLVFFAERCSETQPHGSLKSESSCLNATGQVSTNSPPSSVLAGSYAPALNSRPHPRRSACLPFLSPHAYIEQRQPVLH